MRLKIWRFITLLLSALVTGMAFCHALELPAKMRYPADLYVTLQNSLYVAFGPPHIGALIELAAPVSAIALAILVPHRRPALPWTLTAVGFMLLAFPILFFVFIEPVNTVFRAATPDAVPANWEQIRRQWEYSHLARFFCHLVAFSALVISALVETPSKQLH
ncbi:MULTISPECIES: DUF1772 domain-containing protein [Cyanophyceae]|uniref:DUF1772 domain-containing protein n=1 Tax=Cyanophyceae TaxID=3028117 RepID=UPI001682BD78|nr:MULTISPECIES: DUF1772 domain-containing protein [Cyanophyceae]MBD1919364.1 DUF1772 domain-containing protein [Phormidium sp. FACHB-77]MBD2054374.1 DUF1772 domain-containing protein [Leptolyngbya sp. FACHB-60]